VYDHCHNHLALQDVLDGRLAPELLAQLVGRVQAVIQRQQWYARELDVEERLM
jgi:hypothetical protein